MRSLFIIVVWFGLAIAVTEIVSQVLTVQAKKAAPRGPSQATGDGSNTASLAAAYAVGVSR